MRRLLMTALTVALVLPTAGAQMGASWQPTTRSYSIESTLLGETRPVLITTPWGYDDEPDESFPVLYLLDGEFLSPYAAGVIDLVSKNGDMPRLIVVAVGNTDRTRDFTPPLIEPDPRFPTAGGATPFAGFLAGELMPFVEENYRTHPFRAIVGHSFGGLFALHTLLNNSELFDAYIAASPTIWWNDQALVTQLDERFATLDELNKSLYFTVANEGGDTAASFERFEQRLRGEVPRGFRWASRAMPEETHGSVVPRSVRQGLEFVFSGWTLREPLTLFESGGFDALHAHYAEVSARLGLTRELPADTVVVVAVALANAGRVAEAQAAFEHDPERYPAGTWVYPYLAQKYLAASPPDERAARACLQRTLEMEPGHAGALQALAALDAESP